MKNVVYYFLFFSLLLCYFIKHSFTKREKNKNKNNQTAVYNKLSLYPYFSYEPTNIKQVNNPLVWGFAVGYSWERMSVFISSLRKNGYKGDLVLAISVSMYKYLQNKFTEFNIQPILIESRWPFYSSINQIFPVNETFLKSCSIEMRNYGWLKWNVYRYSVLLCWLLLYGNKYSHIMTLDVKDIVFQGNPFKWNFENGLYVVDEKKGNDILIKNDECNLSWISSYKNYTNIANNKILNSGTIFGSKDYFISFISQFCKFIKDNYVSTAEQGSFIYAYYTGYFKNIKFFMNKNQRGVVLTVFLDLPEVLKLKRKDNTIYNEDGTIPLIVHQYDRHGDLKKIYRMKYT